MHRLPARTFLRWLAAVEALSPTEREFLALLASRRGAVCATATIMDELYGHRTDGGPSAHVLSVYASQVRRKTQLQITVVPGVGYRLEAAA